MPIPSKPAARGQTLVLMALTLLMLVGMVLATLNLASRIKGRLELQTLADANAYSNAVVTARTFNAISITNRAAVATLGAMAGAAAYISYGTEGIAYNHALRQAVANTTCQKDDPTDTCCDGFPGRKAAVIAALTDRLDPDFPEPWNSLDEQANDHVHQNRSRATGMKQAMALMLENMENHIAGPGIPNALAGKLREAANLDEARVGQFEWMDATGVNRNETVGSARPDRLDRGEGGEALTNGGYGMTVLQAVMGTRPDWLINHDIPLHPDDTAACAAEDFSCSGSATGAGYFAVDKHGGAELHATHVWGDAHGSVQVTATVADPCSVSGGSAAATADYQGTDSVDPQGLHAWTPSNALGHGGQKVEHTVGGCDVCPSVWFRPYGFLPDGVDARDDNLRGQPKNYAAVRRDLTADSDNPWNQVMGLTIGGETHQISTKADGTTGEGMRYQHALGTGITYYHRPQTWTEPGNFMNPFWRAALSHGYVDRSAPTELRTVFTGASSTSLDGIEALRAAGHAAMVTP